MMLNVPYHSIDNKPTFFTNHILSLGDRGFFGTENLIFIIRSLRLVCHIRCGQLLLQLTVWTQFCSFSQIIRQSSVSLIIAKPRTLISISIIRSHGLVCHVSWGQLLLRLLLWGEFYWTFRVIRLPSASLRIWAVFCSIDETCKQTAVFPPFFPKFHLSSLFFDQNSWSSWFQVQLLFLADLQSSGRNSSD